MVKTYTDIHIYAWVFEYKVKFGNIFKNEKTSIIDIKTTPEYTDAHITYWVSLLCKGYI